MSGERIETAGDLDALPVGSVVLDGSGWNVAWVRGSTWHSTHHGDMVAAPVLPATVLHRPDRDLIAEAEARGARRALVAEAAWWENIADDPGADSAFTEAQYAGIVAKDIRTRLTQTGGTDD